MCAGYPEKKVSVCKGDSGSGFSFLNPEDNRYYVHGIVSLAPSTKSGSSCNVLTNALYTQVSFYYEFVDVQLNRLNWCKLPNHPKNGKWILQKSSSKVPGDLVSPYDIVEVRCNKGYTLSSPTSTYNCETLLLYFPLCMGSAITEVAEDNKSASTTHLMPGTTATAGKNIIHNSGFVTLITDK